MIWVATSLSSSFAAESKEDDVVRLWVATGALLATLASVGVAEAKGVIIYNSGEEIFESGPLPSPYDKAPKLAGAHAGYKCSIFGFFGRTSTSGAASPSL